MPANSLAFKSDIIQITTKNILKCTVLGSDRRSEFNRHQNW